MSDSLQECLVSDIYKGLEGVWPDNDMDAILFSVHNGYKAAKRVGTSGVYETSDGVELETCDSHYWRWDVVCTRDEFLSFGEKNKLKEISE